MIIPIATSISTWVGVLIFLYSLKKYNYLLLQKQLISNILKILTSSAIMAFALVFFLEKYAPFLDYTYTYKSIFLLVILGSVGIVYLLSCYLLGLLKIKSYKAI